MLSFRTAWTLLQIFHRFLSFSFLGMNTRAVDRPNSFRGPVGLAGPVCLAGGLTRSTDRFFIC